MYYVRIITGEGVEVEHHMLYEPPSFAAERELLRGRDEHWLDVSRIPVDPLEHLETINE